MHARDTQQADLGGPGAAQGSTAPRDTSAGKLVARTRSGGSRTRRRGRSDVRLPGSATTATSSRSTCCRPRAWREDDAHPCSKWRRSSGPYARERDGCACTAAHGHEFAASTTARAREPLEARVAAAAADAPARTRRSRHRAQRRRRSKPCRPATSTASGPGLCAVAPEALYRRPSAAASSSTRAAAKTQWDSTLPPARRRRSGSSSLAGGGRRAGELEWLVSRHASPLLRMPASADRGVVSAARRRRRAANRDR